MHTSRLEECLLKDVKYAVVGKLKLTALYIFIKKAVQAGDTHLLLPSSLVLINVPLVHCFFCNFMKFLGTNLQDCPQPVELLLRPRRRVPLVRQNSPFLTTNFGSRLCICAALANVSLTENAHPRQCNPSSSLQQSWG